MGFSPDTFGIPGDHRSVVGYYWEVVLAGARSVDKINKARVKVNKAVAKFVAHNGGLVVRHCELEGEYGLYLRGDGVHLSAVGIDMWVLGLQDGLQCALWLWRAVHS